MHNKIITDFLLAINNVPDFYHSQPNVYMADSGLYQDVDEPIKKYERRLLTAIFNEYDKVIGSDKHYTGLFPDVEVVKPFFYGTNTNNEVIKSFAYLNDLANKKGKKIDELEFLTTIPDFIVHKSQDDENPKNQLLSAELKTNPNMDDLDFFKDLLKLNLYIEKYKFQNAAFVIANKSEKFIKTYAEIYFSNANLFKSQASTQNLYFIYRPSEKQPFEAFSMSTLLYNGLNNK